MRRTVLAVGAMVVLAACSRGSNDTGAAMKGAKGDAIGVPAQRVQAGGQPAAVGDDVALGRSVIRKAELTVRVGDVETARRSAVTAAERAGGFLESEHSALDTGTTPTLRVRPESFTATLDAVARLGTVVGRAVSTDDVTGDVADVDGRLAAARASAARLRGLLGQATSVSDVAALESELTDRESDIESLATRQRTLAGETALATVTATLRQSVAPPPKVAATGFRGGLRGGWRAFTTTVAVLLVVLGAVAPFAAVGAGAGTLWWWVRRRRARAVAPG